ncbi:Uncharacterised protein [Chromobacterium violaceum]|uniref:Uncharacterized protein n=1 Tax=Chromobacterium violaceum TaxID=536 RepID=A0A447TFA3_CHRVL|nr:Uncharacterised protein [Chromobacterium violaceum]
MSEGHALARVGNLLHVGCVTLRQTPRFARKSADRRPAALEMADEGGVGNAVC